MENKWEEHKEKWISIEQQIDLAFTVIMFGIPIGIISYILYSII